jgi:hypothetical protein
LLFILTVWYPWGTWDISSVCFKDVNILSPKIGICVG